MKKFYIKKASNAFLGVKSMGLFAPLSYWRTKDDWGIGDLDVLLKVIEFAKKIKISIISLLPLNIPLHDNCPYANASTYVFDPVYIGINMLMQDLGLTKQDSDFSLEFSDIFSQTLKEVKKFRNKKKSENNEIRKLKYKIFKWIFERFEHQELKDCKAQLFDFISGVSTSLNINKGTRAGRSFKQYCLSNKWLGDHLLFFILAKTFNTDNFRSWPQDIATHYPDVVQKLKIKHKKELLFEAFLQWVLTQQLQYVRKKAAKGDFKVDIMLDQPFAFGHADVWCCLKAFMIDSETLKRDYTQGAPPHRLDIPQHWQFYLLNTKAPEAKKLMIKRLSFFLQFSDLLRIDHVLGYYRLYYMTEDENQEMTLRKMGIWDKINKIFNGFYPISEKREKIYNIIIQGIKDKFDKNTISDIFDENGNLEYANVILAARSATHENEIQRAKSGWYSQGASKNGHVFQYTLLSPNEFTQFDYLKKIIEEKQMFLHPDDSIRLGFFKLGLGEEIISQFMETAQLQGKTLVFESLGVVPKRISRSLIQLGAMEFKPLIFGYQHFTGDKSQFWFNQISENSYVCFSTQDTITLRGWWEGMEKWSKQKYYFKNNKQKQEVISWLKQQKYLSESSDSSLDIMDHNLLYAVLSSVADSKGLLAVIMMSNIFGSGDEGIINMPGYNGFWTARSSLTIEDLIDEIDNPSTKKTEASKAVQLIRFLVKKQSRYSFQKQIKIQKKSMPWIVATHPVMGKGTKQVRVQGQSFLIDVVIYGKCKFVYLVFENGHKIIMQKLQVKTGLFPGMKIFRAYIPVDEKMIGVFSFQIEIDGFLYSKKGYLVGCCQNTDMNPLSDQYGQISHGWFK